MLLGDQRLASSEVLRGVGIISSQVFGHLRSFKGWIQTEACVIPSYHGMLIPWQKQRKQREIKFRNHYFLFLFAFSILSQLFLIWGCTLHIYTPCLLICSVLVCLFWFVLFFSSRSVSVAVRDLTHHAQTCLTQQNMLVTGRIWKHG